MLTATEAAPVVSKPLRKQDSVITMQIPNSSSDAGQVDISDDHHLGGMRRLMRERLAKTK